MGRVHLTGRYMRGDTARQFRRLTLLCLACMLLLATVASALYTRVVLQRNAMYVAHLMEQYRTSVERSASDASRFARLIAYDASLLEYMTEEDPARRYALSCDVENRINSMKAIQPQIREVFLFESSASDSAFVALLPDEAAILSRIQGNRLPAVAGFYPFNAITGRETLLFVGCSIYDTRDLRKLSEPIGCIAVAMSLEQLEADLNELAQLPGISYAVVDNDFRVISGSLYGLNEDLISEVGDICARHEVATVNRLLQSVSIEPVLDTCGSMLVFTQPSVMLADMLRVLGMVIALTAAMYVLLVLVFRAVRHSIIQPVTRLTNELAGGGLPADYMPEGNGDIRALTNSLLSLLSSERYLSARLNEMSLMQTRLELQFLRSQINPHFIYNSLETVRAIAAVRGVPEVAQIAKSLAAILRYSIKGDENVELSVELGIVRNYLEIQSIRFGDRLDYDFEVDEDVCCALIPRMCLQPLVENAVTHGLEQKVEGGRLILSAHRDGDELYINVSDNGVGIEPQRLSELNALLSSGAESAPADDGALRGVGLLNVTRRIQLARGNRYGMSLQNSDGGGLSVTIRIPFVSGTAARRD